MGGYLNLCTDIVDSIISDYDLDVPKVDRILYITEVFDELFSRTKGCMGKYHHPGTDIDKILNSDDILYDIYVGIATPIIKKHRSDPINIKYMDNKKSIPHYDRIREKLVAKYRNNEKRKITTILKNINRQFHDEHGNFDLEKYRDFIAEEIVKVIPNHSDEEMTEITSEIKDILMDSFDVYRGIVIYDYNNDNDDY